MSAFPGGLRTVLVAAVALVAGCGSAPTRSCTVDVVVELDVVGRDLQPCGNFKLGSDGGSADADFATAQACVLAAVAAGRGFALVYDVPGTNHLRVGLDGVVDAGHLAVREYAYAGDAAGKPGDAHPRVSRQECVASAPGVMPAIAPVSATPGCTPAVGRPCLTCNTPAHAASGSIVCAP